MYFLKIFHHDISAGYFTKETAKYNPNNPKLFSIISTINDNYKIDNKFTFLVYWDDPATYNIWKQDLNPINDPEDSRSNKKTTGFIPIISKATSIHSQCLWGGLALSNNIKSLLDGCIKHNDWVYSIGMTQYGVVWDNGYIPSPQGAAKTATLWVRVLLNMYTSEGQSNNYQFAVYLITSCLII